MENFSFAAPSAEKKEQRKSKQEVLKNLENSLDDCFVGSADYEDISIEPLNLNEALAKISQLIDRAKDEKWQKQTFRIAIENITLKFDIESLKRSYPDFTPYLGFQTTNEAEFGRFDYKVQELVDEVYNNLM